MKDSEQTVRIRLLEAAKKEFLEKGYGKASLRKICTDAGVTTGALYFLFQNKEDLFEQVIQGTVIQFQQMTQDMVEKELADPSYGVDNEKQLLEFAWKNREVLIILLEGSQGTGYENFAEEMINGLEDNFYKFFCQYGAARADRELIRILVKMKMQGYVELIMGGYTLEKTLELAEQIGWYAEGGFQSLMKELNNRM